MSFLPGMEPDFYVKQELRFVGGVLDLRQFDKVFISISGGKDSHAMTFLVKEIAEAEEMDKKDPEMNWLGHECDKVEWLKFREVVRAELKKRGEIV